jgi:outer membrane protein TolC
MRHAKAIPLMLLFLLVAVAGIPLAPRHTEAQQIAPLPDPGKVLTLEEAVMVALGRQPQILASLGQLEAAQAKVVQAMAPLLPQATLTYNQRRSQGFQASSANQFTITNYLLQQTATQKIFDFGKTWAATEAARFTAQASREVVEGTRNQIVFDVKRSYFTLLLAQRLVTVNAQALERAELNLRTAQGFYQVGTRPKSDVTRAEVDVATARVNQIRANNAVHLARVALNTAMGITPAAPTQIKDILGYEPMPVEPNALAQEALTNRPEIRQARAEVQSAEASVREKFRQFFPDLNANASYGYTNNEFPLKEIWELGFTFTWTWFEGFGNVGRLREAKANLETARANAANVELTVRQEVTQAYLDLIAAEEQIQATAKATESARENFRLAQGRFDAGVGTIIELTDAQLALTQAQANEATALADYQTTRANLERALGRR